MISTDSTYWILNVTNSNDGDVVGHHGSSNYDVWLAKIDNAGNLLWQYTYGAYHCDYFYNAAIQKSDWDYVVAIEAYDSAWKCYGGPYSSDVRIFEFYDSTLVGVNIPVASTESEIRVLPNPASHFLTIDISENQISTNTLITLLDVSGKKLYSHHINRFPFKINVGKLAPG